MLKETVFKSFDSKEQLEQQLAQRIADALQAAIDTRGKASLVVSGGATPIGLFDKLSRKVLDWSEVFITLADERWVDTDSADSNEHLVRQHLLQHFAASAKFRGLKNMFATAEAGVAMTTEQLANIPRPFDVVVLGMGNDGHTCSWFPSAPAAELQQALTTDALLCAVHPQAAPHARITLSRNAIMSSRQIYLHLVGQQKLDVYHQALVSDNVNEMPIRAILSQHKTPVDVYWAA
ncbi:6-phosphogluconolactonase [Shewanella yunxiaonensis]|uniref:6-phosphogluconolactonase n=1 Tax=Shewanella yunxiaonensis TaxID=2829809 RepID=A0ABX7YQ39_9GAMM|nr:MULTISPECIES: 6-phosphogluconolactonase [Shewanella]MDF0535902.1 6-phosphogluconolactonase [Shewanella sp. A32]QUN04489.1 6-phosphogluconolactonase [Shewanella yunxiaonensis]